MAKHSHKGKFIVFEGIDGSGKSTQTKLLARYLRKQGFKTARIEIPQHGEKSCGLVDDYLKGKYGSSKEVSPYIVAMFFGCDRYDASFKIRKWLKEGRMVIADRYVGSNIGHQGGKIKNRTEWKKFLKWVYELEYEFFGIPKPALSIILKTDPGFSLKLAHKITDKEKRQKRKVYLGNKKRDIHENRSHLKDALNSYLQAAKALPTDFKVVECVEKGKLLTPAIVHQKVLKIVKKIL